MTDEALLIFGCVVSFITLAGMRASFAHAFGSASSATDEREVRVTAQATANPGR